jgi:hypothetical protein
MGSQHRRRLIAAGGIVAIGAISAIVVALVGSASSDSSGLGPTGAYRVEGDALAQNESVQAAPAVMSNV